MKFIYIIILIFLLSACENIKDVNQSNNNKDDVIISDYKIEEYEFGYQYNTDKFIIKMRTNNDKEQFQNMISRTEEITDTIESFYPISNKVEIEIDDRYDKFREIAVYKPEDKIKISCNEISNEEYNKKLISCLYNIKEPWIIEGLYHRLFGENIDMEFEEYFQDKELSFFGARFYKQFNTEEINNLQYAAKDLIDFIILNHSKDFLINQRVTFKEIKPWFEKHNIDSEYQKSIDMFMNSFQFSNTSLKPLIMESEQLSYTVLNIDPQWDTAYKIESFMISEKKDRDKVNKIIKENVPRFYDECLENKVDSINVSYEFNNMERINFAQAQTNTIALKNLEANVHEYVHTVLMENTSSIRWLNEGLAQYFDYLYFDNSISQYIEILSPDINLLTSDEKQIYFEIKNYFISKGGIIPVDNEIKDIRQRKILMDTFAYIESKLGTPKNILEVLYGRTMPLPKEEIGKISEANELSYLQALSFTNYLIENYSLEKILYLSLSTESFEKAFNKSYNELKRDWLNTIKP